MVKPMPEEVEPEETLVEPVKEQKPSDIVKVKVLIGAMHFEKGLFLKGETFTITRERASQFDPKDIQIVES